MQDKDWNNLKECGFDCSKVQELSDSLGAELEYAIYLGRKGPDGHTILEVAMKDPACKYVTTFITPHLKILVDGLPSPVPVYDTEEE